MDDLRGTSCRSTVIGECIRAPDLLSDIVQGSVYLSGTVHRCKTNICRAYAQCTEHACPPRTIDRMESRVPRSWLVNVATSIYGASVMTLHKDLNAKSLRNVECPLVHLGVHANLRILACRGTAVFWSSFGLTRYGAPLVKGSVRCFQREPVYGPVCPQPLGKHTHSRKHIIAPER